MTAPDRGIPAAIAARHGIAPEQVVPVPGGEASHAYLLGEALFLRIARPGAQFAADLRTEAAVVPLAREVGVRTPEILDSGDDHTLTDRPWLITRRLAGTDLAQLDQAPLAQAPLAQAPLDQGQLGQAHNLSGGWRESILVELGRDLAHLHGITPTALHGPPHTPPQRLGIGPGRSVGVAQQPAGAPDRLAGLPHFTPGDPLNRITLLAGDGYLDPQTARWLRRWTGRLADELPGGDPEVLVHGDIAAQNILVDPATGALEGVVDWGDAGWGDPAVEFAKLRLADVVPVLRGYRTHAPAGNWEARILGYHLDWALARLVDSQPRPGARHWTAPPPSRILELLRFFASDPPEPWRSLGPPS